MKAIGYFNIRESGGSYAFENRLADYCQRNGHQLIRIFIDEDLSVSERPKYIEMMAYLREHGMESLVIVGEARDLGDSLEVATRNLLEIDSFGAKVLCCGDEEAPDPFQQIVRQWSRTGTSGSRSNLIKEGMMAKAMRGRGLGKPPFGYRVNSEGKLEERIEEGDVVRLIFHLYTNDDVGLRRIVSRLNEQGIPTRSGAAWSLVTVRDMLRNRAYLGTYTRFGMRIPGSHQAIIGTREFNIAQEKMTRDKPDRVPYARKPFLLSGVMFCSFCGNKMVGVTRRQGWRRKDGSNPVGYYRYYQCQSRTNQGMCRYRTWRSSDLEGIVLGKLKERLESRSVDFSKADINIQGDKDLEKTLKRLETVFYRTLQSVAAGTVAVQNLRDLQMELELQRGFLREDISAKNPVLELLKSHDPAYILNCWDDLNQPTLTQIIRSLVAKVHVGDHSSEVILRCLGETGTTN